MADWQSRTEAPTPRRREQARERGQVAVSQDLSAGLTLLCGAMTLKLLEARTGGQLLRVIQGMLERLPSDGLDAGRSVQIAWVLAHQTWSVCFGLVGLVLMVGVVFTYLQAGPGISWRVLALRWEKLSPAKGWQRIFSSRSAMRGILAVLKAAAITAAVLVAIRLDLESITRSGNGTLPQATAVGWNLVVRATAVVGIFLVALGLLDYLYQRWHHEQQLRMTREDVKEERRQEEGDPHMRARIKKLQREMSRKSLSDVPKATVVLTNPTHLAVALRYDRQTMPAPVLVAKGADFRARRIVQVAEKVGVPVLERKPLAQALYRQVEVGQPIPPDLYRAVAEVLAYLHRLNAHK